MSKAMTADEARQVFDKALEGETNPDRVAKVELMREFFCNPAFRQAMADEVWRLTRKGA